MGSDKLGNVFKISVTEGALFQSLSTELFICVWGYRSGTPNTCSRGLEKEELLLCISNQPLMKS